VLACTALPLPSDRLRVQVSYDFLLTGLIPVGCFHGNILIAKCMMPRRRWTAYSARLCLRISSATSSTAPRDPRVQRYVFDSARLDIAPTVRRHCRIGNAESCWHLALCPPCTPARSIPPPALSLSHTRARARTHTLCLLPLPSPNPPSLIPSPPLPPLLFSTPRFFVSSPPSGVRAAVRHANVADGAEPAPGAAHPASAYGARAATPRTRRFGSQRTRSPWPHSSVGVDASRLV